MNQSTEINRQIVLASRPVGAPTKANFKLQHVPMPRPEYGEVLLRTVYA